MYMIDRNLGRRARGLICTCVVMAASQPLSMAQTSAIVSEDHAEATAGQPFTLHLTFDVAATCDHNVRMPLANVAAGQSFTLFAHLITGSNVVDVKEIIPKDFSGEFVSNTTQYGSPNLQPCEGYSVYKQISVPTVTLNIKPIPDSNSYPASAKVEFSLTQQQFLDTKIAQLDGLSGEIDTRVDNNARDTRELRNFLARIVERAEAYLTATQKEYERMMLKPGETLPGFFTDFHRHYANLHTELRAPIPGESANASPIPRLVLAHQSLQKRPSPAKPVRSNNASGSAPIVATGVKSIVEDNASAYKIVGIRGTHPTFHATFESRPDGATLYYRPEFDPAFQIWSKTTNIEGADFPLGWYVFKFHRDDCQDEPVRTINPMENTNPDVSVEFKRCKKK